MNKVPACLAVVLVSACTPLVDNSGRMAMDVKETAISAQEKIKEYFTYTPAEKPAQPPPQERYCYKILQDIVCYAEPYSPLAPQLMGWQSPNSVESIPVVDPVESARVQATATTQEKEIQPIFISKAPDPKEVKRVLRSDEQTPNSQLY